MPNENDISDEELVADAHDLARSLMKHVGLERAAFLNGLDAAEYAAWMHALTVELGRLGMVSIMSAGAPIAIWDCFFTWLAKASVDHLQAGVKTEAIRQARFAAAKLDQPQEGVVN